MQGMSAMSSIQAQNLQNQKLRYEMEKDKEERQKASMANQLSGFVYALNKDPAVAYGMIPDALWMEISKHPSFARFATPEGREQIRDNYSKLVLSMPNETNGGRFNVPQIKESLNVLLGDELNKGTADDGKPALKKEIASIYPNKDGSFFIELNVTRQDGSSYRAPLTTGRTSDPKDTVRPVNIEELADHLRVKDSLATYLEAKLIGLGDKEAEKRAYNQIKGSALAKALREMNESQSVDDRRRRLAIAGLEAGVTPIEMAQLGPTAIPNPDYRLSQIGVGDDQVQTHVFDANRGTASPIGKPVGKFSPAASGKGGGGINAQNWKERNEILKQFGKLQSQKHKLMAERAKIAANLGKTTTVEDVDEFGKKVKHTVVANEVNLKAYDDAIAQLEKEIQELQARYSDPSSGAMEGGSAAPQGPVAAQAGPSQMPAPQAPPEVAPEIESHEEAPTRRRLVDTGKTQDGVRLLQDQDTKEIVREDGKPVRRKQSGPTQYFGNAPVF